MALVGGDMRELLILRHGKAEKDDSDGDNQRPLKDSGKRGAQRMGVWLAGQGLLPDDIVASPAVRAKETAAKCIKAMGADERQVRKDERLYRADVCDLLAALADCPAGAQRVLLIGHNPGLKQLIGHLCRTGQEVDSFPKGALVQLRLGDDWGDLEAGQGELVQLVRAKELPKKFPFPSPHGDERRDRPAYYYTQSAVVPFRVENGLLQILIVRSSQGKHWVLPKGIGDPGRSLQESAAREAWEEAGVEGDVQQTAIGAYSYAKWGATCTVSVFPMQVTRMLKVDQWEENHRGRQWVSPRVATMLLKQPELGEIVTAFSRQFEIGSS
jgi:phosphohistidine phosphatase